MDVSNQEPLTVGIIGAGEMGAAVGQRLREGGARAITTLRGRSPASVERVRRAGLETVDDDSDFVLESDLIRVRFRGNRAENNDCADYARHGFALAQPDGASWRVPVHHECR